MKWTRFIFLSIFLLGICTPSNSFAQSKERAQELLADISKANDKEVAFQTLEKGLLPVAQSQLNGFTVSEVRVDRKTGMISIIGKNGKGQTETLQNVTGSTYYSNKTNTSTNAKKNVFERFWDWLWGTSAPAPEPEDEHQGDPLPDNFGKKPSPEDWMNGNADH